MSELYKRALGYRFNEDALRRELANGVTGYDTSTEYTQVSGGRSLAEVNEDIMEFRALEEQQELDIEFMVITDQMIELAEEHPKYTWHVGQLLSERLDELKKEGHPVDAEMYVEATDLAEEIVATNPDMNAEELTIIVEVMVGMIQAEYHRRHHLLAV